MKSWIWITAGAGLTSVLPVAWMVWKPSLAAGAVTAIWAAAASVGAAWLVLRSEKRRQQAIVRNMEHASIRMLNHHRHDWMNELQILYGYIQLGKLDKSVACVERIKERMALESKISKLGIPSLVFIYIHTGPPATICSWKLTLWIKSSWKARSRQERPIGWPKRLFGRSRLSR